MPALHAVFEGLGFAGVQTHIQSGNAVFESDDAPDVGQLEQAIENEFGFHVDIVLRSAAEWAALTPRNPYPQELDGTHLHVAFLNTAPSVAEMATICALPGNTWEASGREIYLHTSDGMGRSELTLGQLKHATVRNWRTVGRVGEMLGRAGV